MRRTLAGAIVVLTASTFVLAACTSSTRSSPAPSTSPPPALLPIGKDDLALDGSYFSPAGFAPRLLLDVPAGWVTVHRGSDGFDLSRPDAAADAPEIAIVVMTPPERTAAAALASIRRHANGKVFEQSGRIAGVRARGFDIEGGTGELAVSAARSIALDATPRGRIRVLAADIGSTPVMLVVLVAKGQEFSRLVSTAVGTVAIRLG